MSHRLDLLVIVCAVSASAVTALAQNAAPSKPARFETDVAPILKSNCTGCHGDSVKMKELNLTT